MSTIENKTENEISSDYLSTNIFNYAPHELSDSAYIAWLLASTGPDAHDVHPSVVKVGKALLKSMDCEDLEVESVATERPVLELWNCTHPSSEKNRDRLDILVTGKRDGKAYRLGVEMKVTARMSEDQLNRYTHAKDCESETEGQLVFLSLNYDFDRRNIDILCNDKPCSGILCIERNDFEKLVRDAIEGESELHPLVRDHLAWMESKHAPIQRWNSHLENKDDLTSAYPLLASTDSRDWSEAKALQWTLMQLLMKDVEGRQDNGDSKGQPYTQFRFRESDPGEQGDSARLSSDAFFYRLDHYADHADLSLRAFQPKGKSVKAVEYHQHKEARDIFNRWAEVRGEIDLNENLGGYNEGKKGRNREREILRFKIGEGTDQNTIQSLLEEIPKMHRKIFE